MKKRGNRSRIVYDILRQAILEQRLGPGTKLPEDTIGEQLGVSRTIVRRALDMLGAEELVIIEPNRSAAVASPTIEEARDIFSVRMDLERLVIERLSGKLTKKQEKLLLKSIENEENSHTNRQPDYVRKAAEFHILLAEMAGSPLLLKYVSSLVAKSPIILGLYGRPNWPSCSVQEHRDVVKALVNNDQEKALSIMKEHLDALLIRALEGAKDDSAENLRVVLDSYKTASFN